MSTSERVAPQPLPGRARREFRDAVASPLAQAQHGVCSRAQLRGVGISRDDVRHEIEAGRWQKLGDQTVQLSAGGGASAQWRRAIWETRGDVRLDGVTALLAAGLTGWDERTIHVSVIAGSRVRSVPGVRIH